MFTIQETVNTSRVDEQGRLKLFSAAQMMQDCSEMWIDSEPICKECFKNEGRAQLLASRQIEVIRVPEFKERLSITTSVFDCKELFGFRNTIIRDEQGNPCYVTWSMGAFIDLASGKLRKLPQEILESLTYDEKYPMDYLDRRIRVPKEEPQESFPYVVCRNDIDYNHHMNNAHYVRLAMEALPSDFQPHRIRIEYKVPLRIDEKATISHLCEENLHYVIISCERGISTVLEFQ